MIIHIVLVFLSILIIGIGKFIVGNANIICLGELLIDMMPEKRVANIFEQSFSPKAGGAPANVCAVATKLGIETSFSGSIGSDSFGKMLLKHLETLDINTNLVHVNEQHLTTIAFVSLDESGERDFIFSRGADAFMPPLSDKIIEQFSIIHFGSATALIEGGTLPKTYEKAAKDAERLGKIITFDPNFRSALVKDIPNFIKKSHSFIEFSDLVKVSEEEAVLLGESEDLDTAIDTILSIGTKVVLVTQGASGTLVATNDYRVNIPSINVDVKDTTGAGDAFMGAVLAGIARADNPKSVFSKNHILQLLKIVRLANITGALVTTDLGATTAIPTYQEVVEISTDQPIDLSQLI